MASSIPFASADSSYAALIFLTGAEVERHVVRLAPVPGRYLIRMHHAGDIQNWPARLLYEVEVGG